MKRLCYDCFLQSLFKKSSLVLALARVCVRLENSLHYPVYKEGINKKKRNGKSQSEVNYSLILTQAFKYYDLNFEFWSYKQNGSSALFLLAQL